MKAKDMNREKQERISRWWMLKKSGEINKLFAEASALWYMRKQMLPSTTAEKCEFYIVSLMRFIELRNILAAEEVRTASETAILDLINSERIP